MLTLQTKVRVTQDGTLEVSVPATALLPGEHEAVIVVGAAPSPAAEPRRRPSQLADFPVREGGEWLDGVSLRRREDLYGDDGR